MSTAGRGPITSHVLDLASGRPAAGIEVALLVHEGEIWREVGRATTDGDGRVQTLLAPTAVLVSGSYRLHFAVGRYFEQRHEPTFYPEVEVTFIVDGTQPHYHVPLLLSPFGYSTYRGS